MASPPLPGGASDEDNGEDEPKHVAEDDNLHHVQVGPAGDRGQGSDEGGSGGGEASGRSQPAGHEVWDGVEMEPLDWMGGMSVVRLTVVSRQQADSWLLLLLKHLQL